MRRWKLTALGRHSAPHVFRGPNLLPDETVEVVSLSEVREALLADEAIKAGRATLVSRDPLVREVVETVFDAAFSSTDSEGQS